MRRAYFTLLLATLISTTHAATLSSTDWWTEPEAPQNTFVFQEDGTLCVTGNSNGKELFYIIKEEAKGTNPMQNGSGLAIDLQFYTTAFLNDNETELYISFHNDNLEISGEEFFQRISIASVGNTLNIYDYSAKMDFYHTLDVDNEITKVQVNFMVENDMLCCSYTVNGQESSPVILKETNTQLDWKPSLGVSNTETNVFTVTDVSFLSVPEPTTVSLTLLALAGHALRRRRK